MVKGLNTIIDEKVLQVNGSSIVTKWIKVVSRKVNIFIWRLRHMRVLVRVILDNMGIHLDSLLWPCCQDAVETLEHCMLRWAKTFKMMEFGSSSLQVLGLWRNSYYIKVINLGHKKIKFCAKPSYGVQHILYGITVMRLCLKRKFHQLDLCVEVQVLSFFVLLA